MEQGGQHQSMSLRSGSTAADIAVPASKSCEWTQMANSPTCLRSHKSRLSQTLTSGLTRLHEG